MGEIKNKSNLISQDKLDGNRQFETNRLIASWDKYSPLEKPKSSPRKNFEHSKADLIIFSDSLSKTEKLIASTLKYAIGINVITVFFSSNLKNEIDKYKELTKKFLSVQIYNLKNQPRDTYEINSFFKKILNYVIIADSNNIFVDTIDLDFCIQELEKTFATGFYLSFNTVQNSTPTYAPISNEIGAWQFNSANDKWACPYNFDMALYKKDKLLERFFCYGINNIGNFKDKWVSLNNQKEVDRNIGLFPIKTVCLKV